ncbi:hypothetical protein ES705_08240 [subsurface metagenome]
MSKINKNSVKSQPTKKKENIEEKFAYRSVILSAIFGGLFFTISILLNGEIITLFQGDNPFLLALDITIKVLVILIFNILIMVSLGNYKELTGKPVDFKIIGLLFFFSLIQAFRNSFVFSFTLGGLLVIVLYLYFVQDS